MRMLLLAVPVWLAASVLTVAGQEAAALEGDYRLLVEESDDVELAVRTATEDAGFFVRRIGRGVLVRMLDPAATLAIRFSGSEVSIAEAGRGALSSPLGGGSVQVRNQRGERERVSTLMEGDTLVRVHEASKARRSYRYTVDRASQQLHVSVTVTGEMLQRPVRLLLRYARAEP